MRWNFYGFLFGRMLSLSGNPETNVRNISVQIQGLLIFDFGRNQVNQLLCCW